jgi:hypothetical protein
VEATALGHELSVGERLGQALLRPALGAAVSADPCIDHDAEHPRPKVRPLVEGVESGPCLREGLLDEILGIVGVVRIAAGSASQFVAQRQRLPLEAPCSGEFGGIHWWVDVFVNINRRHVASLRQQGRPTSSDQCRSYRVQRLFSILVIKSRDDTPRLIGR